MYYDVYYVLLLCIYVNIICIIVIIVNVTKIIIPVKNVWMIIFLHLHPRGFVSGIVFYDFFKTIYSFFLLFFFFLGGHGGTKDSYSRINWNHILVIVSFGTIIFIFCCFCIIEHVFFQVYCMSVFPCSRLIRITEIIYTVARHLPSCVYYLRLSHNVTLSGIYESHKRTADRITQS